MSQRFWAFDPIFLTFVDHIPICKENHSRIFNIFNRQGCWLYLLHISGKMIELENGNEKLVNGFPFNILCVMIEYCYKQFITRVLHMQEISLQHHIQYNIF